MSGLVYYVLDATRNEQRVKIGHTTNLAGRLAELSKQTMSRQNPLVLALEAGGLDLESDRHRQFRTLRIIGEWFRYEDEVKDWIANSENPIAFLGDRPDLWWYARGWQHFTGWAPTPLVPSVVLTASGHVDFGHVEF